MDKILKTLLESEVLTVETRQELSEAWNTRLNEEIERVRQEESQKLREEFSARYEQDRAQIVSAMEVFVNQRLDQEISEMQEDRKKVHEQRVELANNTVKLRKQYRTRLREHMELLTQFLNRTLHEELNELHKDASDLKRAQKKTRLQLAESRQQYRQETARRVTKLEDFVVKQLNREMNEVRRDTENLREQRVRMIADARREITSSKKRFLQQGSQLVEKFITKTLRDELSALYEDIQASRRNKFGQRIYEAFASEFFASHASDGTKIKKQMNETARLKKMLEKTQRVTREQQRIIRENAKKLELANERYERSRVMNNLLNPLSRDQKRIMEQLLRDTDTDSLVEEYNRHLKSVLKETKSEHGNKEPARRKLSESNHTPRKTLVHPSPPREVTGNRIHRRLPDPASIDDEAIFNEMRQLSGITKE